MAAGSGAAAVAADCGAANLAPAGVGVLVVVAERAVAQMVREKLVVAERAVAQMVREKLVELAQSTSLLMSSATR